MSLVIAATVGLCVWIVLWALNISGLDAILPGVGLVLIVMAVRVAAPARQRDE